MKYIPYISVLFAALLMSPWLEQTLVTHLLILYPMVVCSGICVGLHFRIRLKCPLDQFDPYGASLIIIATFTLIFWMIPNWLDQSLNNTLINIGKYVSLFLLVGMPTGLAWQSLGALGRALVKIEFVTMLLRLGWLYLITPERLCLNYLISDQIILGKLLLIVATFLIWYWLIPLFYSSPLPTHRSQINTES